MFLLVALMLIATPVFAQEKVDSNTIRMSKSVNVDVKLSDCTYTLSAEQERIISLQAQLTQAQANVTKLETVCSAIKDKVEDKPINTADLSDIEMVKPEPSISRLRRIRAEQ